VGTWPRHSHPPYRHVRREQEITTKAKHLRSYLRTFTGAANANWHLDTHRTAQRSKDGMTRTCTLEHGKGNETRNECRHDHWHECKQTKRTETRGVQQALAPLPLISARAGTHASAEAGTPHALWALSIR